MIVRKFLSRVARKVAAVSTNLSRTLHRSPDEARKDVWFRDNVETTLRQEYDLDADSIVFDVGGYEGHWASDIFSRYCCKVHVFEPVKPFADGITKRFAGNPKIASHAYGLAGENKTLSISVEAYASSVFKESGQTQEIKLVDAVEFIDQHQIERIDLMKVNIEGGEYELIERLIASGYIQRVLDLQVQFHDFVPDAESRMHRLQEQLRATHSTTYQYPFVWENWRLKTPTVETLPAGKQTVAAV